MERKWIDMAKESLEAAELLFMRKRFRSCVNRAYYTMYQATQAILLFSGQEPPARGNWSHQSTVESMHEIRADLLRRFGIRSLIMRQRFTRVMQLRVDADYNPQSLVKASDAREAIRFAGQFLRIGREVCAT